jgi:mannose/fructose/N-acetylgalactosamine-specific phosphotransferase system component IID
MGPLAAMGDPFFHSGFTPLATVMAAIIALVFGSLAGIIAIVVIFNSVHMAFRVSGVFVGYRHGENALNAIGQWISPAKTWWARTGTSIFAGILLSIISFRFGDSFDLSFRPIVVCSVTLLLAILLNKRRSLWVVLMPAFLLAALIMEVIIPA